jgi:hypothetical protein
MAEKEKSSRKEEPEERHQLICGYCKVFCDIKGIDFTL